MAPSDPQAGSVIRYAYLWRHEADAGQEHGKDRPCVVLRVGREEDGGRLVDVLPITTRPPDDHRRTVEIPEGDAKSIGLGDGRSWIVTDEMNTFRWPSPEVIPPLPGKRAYQPVSPDLLSKSRERVIEHAGEQQLRALDRERYADLVERREQRGQQRGPEGRSSGDSGPGGRPRGRGR